MGLFGTISSLWKSFVGDDPPSPSEEGYGDMVTAMIEHDTRTEREEANVGTEAVVKEPIEETESADGMAGEEVDAESHMDDEDARDDAEVVADAIEEAEPEDEAVEPEPEPESEVEVGVEVDDGPEVRGGPEFEDEDEESDGAEVENEEFDDETIDNADVPTADRIRDIGLAYAERLSGIGIEIIADPAAIDVDGVSDGIDVSPKRVQCWIDHVGDA